MEYRFLPIPLIRLACVCLSIIIVYYLISIRGVRIMTSLPTKSSSPTPHQKSAITNVQVSKRINASQKSVNEERNKTKEKKKIKRKPKPLPQYFQADVQVPGINCDLVYRGSKKEIRKAKQLKQTQKHRKNFIFLSRNCVSFRKDQKYVTDFITQMEKKFPIAYSIIVRNSVYQFESLFRALYRPQNYYCVSFDKKTPDFTKKSIKAIMRCFPNIAVVETPRIKPLPAVKAHLKCARTLLRQPKWKYFINLDDEDFPLKTNYDIVNVLQNTLKGSNDVKGRPIRPIKGKIVHPPNGLFGFIGSPRVILNRQTITFAAQNPRANGIMAWANSNPNAHKTFFATIHYNPKLGIPGTHRGPINNKILKSRQHYTSFSIQKGSNLKCKGMMEKGQCVFGVSDLPALVSRKELFAHKWKWDYEIAARRCLEKRLHDTTKSQYLYFNRNM